MGPEERDEFRRFLKRGGRSASAQDRCLAFVAEYEDFLVSVGTPLGESGTQELNSFVEQGSTDWAKTRLWALKYYFDFLGNEGLSELAGSLRQSMIRRKPVALDDFIGVAPEIVAKLAVAGVVDSQQLLDRCVAPEDRASLAESAGLEATEIEEIAKLADLARLPGVKGIRARLYFDAGVETLDELTAWDPEELYFFLLDWVERSGFAGVAPTPGEVAGTCGTAGRLPRLVDWSSQA